MLCKFDRAGVIQAKNGWRSVAALTRIPLEVVERAGAELILDGRVRVAHGGFLAPNFTEAQTASKSDKARQKESRDRRRANYTVTKRDVLSQNVTESHDASHAVTFGHALSQNVTLTSALPPVAPVALSLPVTKRDTTPLSQDATGETGSPLGLVSVPDHPAALANQPKSRPKPKSFASPEAIAAATRLLTRVIANNPSSTLAKAPEAKREQTAVRWANAMRLLHDVDGHSWEEIDKVIDWSQQEAFWKTTILSGDNLREKWDRLTAKINHPINQKPSEQIRNHKVL
jgi:hypothetical protein